LTWLKVFTLQLDYTYDSLKPTGTTMTSSEIIVTALIWVLTAAGCFFGIRAALRRRKKK